MKGKLIQGVDDVSDLQYEFDLQAREARNALRAFWLVHAALERTLAGGRRWGFA